jgi:hypothetical protein
MTIVPNWAPYQILAGPADVYLAATGTAFPAVNASPGGSWTNIGRTEGGVNVQHSNTVQMITSDQNTGPIKALRTDEGLEVSFSLIELTLENYAKVLNGATVTAAAGPPAIKTIQLHQGYNVALFAMLVRSYSPYGAFNGQYQVPVVCQTDQPQVAYTKQDKAVLASTWTALEDLNASTDSERFGQLIAQTS